MKTRKKKTLVNPSDVDRVVDLLLSGYYNIDIADKAGISESMSSRITSYFEGSNNGKNLSANVKSYMDKKYGLPRKEKLTLAHPIDRPIKEQLPYYETKLFFGLITIRSFPKFK